MKIEYKKYLDYIIFYLVPLFLLLDMYYVYTLGLGFKETMISWGDYSFKLVLIIVIMKPIIVIFDKYKFLKKFLIYRKELGILAFWFAIFHAVSLLFYLNLLDPKILFDFKKNYFYGLISLLGMLILGLTSNKFSMIKLKSKWKKVQMLVFPTLIFISIHKIMAENDFGPYIILIIITILKIIQYYLENKRKKERLNKNNKNK